MDRHYLVLPRDPASQRRIALRVRALGGMVLLTIGSGTLVVRMREATKDEIAAMPETRHCGAIEITPRPIRRIRVREDGTRLAG